MKILNQIFLTATAVVLLAGCSYNDEPLDGGYYHLTVAEPYSYDSCYFMLDGQSFSSKTASLLHLGVGVSGAELRLAVIS